MSPGAWLPATTLSRLPAQVANLTAQLKSETARATLLNLATDHTLVRSSGRPVFGWAGAVLGWQELSAVLAWQDMAQTLTSQRWHGRR